MTGEPTIVSTGCERAWLRACIGGELVGFIPPAVTGTVLVSTGASDLVLLVGLILAGTAEGWILGSAQQRVLHRFAPTVVGWPQATAVGAGIAWCAGMGGSMLVGEAGPIALLVVAPSWLAGLVAMPALQQHRLSLAGLRRTHRWIPWSVVAWMFGVSVPVVALSIVPNNAPAAVHVVIAIVAAVAMGAIVGLVTGRVLQTMLRPTSRTGPPADLRLSTIW